MKRVKTKTKESNKLQPKGTYKPAKLGDGLKARKEMTLYRIKSPSLVSEIFVTKGTCVAGSPAFMLGQPITSIKAYCQKKGWNIELVDLSEVEA